MNNLSRKSCNSSGFTLLELSIVIVIIGLIVGGITVGQGLIKAAELRALANDFNQYQSTILVFKDKYRALPGDMRNATTFWGEANATPATCKTTDSTTLADPKNTCNGDGDGNADNIAGSYENYRLWQHLANAGLIKGQYTGIPGPNNAWHTIAGVNAPESNVAGVAWSVWGYYGYNYPGDSYDFAGDYGNVFYVGRPSSTAPFLNPQEVLSIDTKLDDGRPGLGKVYVGDWDNCTDATSETDNVNANYLPSDDFVYCQLIFLRIF